jgi:hypothetical protein
MSRHEGPNDGIVSSKSAEWGTHIECLELNHLEQLKLNIDKKRVPLWEKSWSKIMTTLSELGH